MVSEHEYAALSAFVYNDQRGGGPQGTTNKLIVPPTWRRLEADGFASPGLLDSSPVSFRAGAFINDAGEIVISFKGTDLMTDGPRAWNTGMDIVADVGLAGGSVLGLGQLVSAADYFLEVVRWASEHDKDPSKITFTGHSLGGGLASIMSVWFDRSSTNFAQAPFALSTANPIWVSIAAAALLRSAVVHGSVAVAAEITHLLSLGVPFEYQRREASVTNYHVRGEVLSYARDLQPNTMGPDHEIDTGFMLIWKSVSLHSINLHSALLMDDRLRQLCLDLPGFRDVLLGSAYSHDPNSPSRDFLTSLVNEQLKGELTRTNGPLGRFVSDVQRLMGDGLIAQDPIRRALILAAIERYFFGDASATTPFFERAGNALHFTFADIPSAEIESLRDLATAIDPLLSQDLKYVSGLLRRADAWHLATGGGAVAWYGAGDVRDAVVGGSTGDDINGGGGDDVVLGANGADTLAGGSGNDVLVGGEGDDTLTGGADDDKLYGGIGADVYRFYHGDGRDVVVDEGGSGILYFNDALISVTERIGENTWKSADGQLTIERRVTGVSGEYSLSIVDSDHSTTITIRNWHPGELGLYLNDDPIEGGNDAPPGTTNVIDTDTPVFEGNYDLRYFADRYGGATNDLFLSDSFTGGWRRLGGDG